MTTPPAVEHAALPCVYCNAPEGPPGHVCGERKCCPDCDHRATSWVREARVAEHKAEAAQGIVERLQQEIENHKAHYRKLLEAYNEQGVRLARYTTTEA